MLNVRTITLSTTQPVKCKCGTYPKIGDRFWYASKYDDGLVEGVIKQIHGYKIESTKGVTYECHDIEINRKDIIRSEKLDQLGL